MCAPTLYLIPRTEIPTTVCVAHVGIGTGNVTVDVY